MGNLADDHRNRNPYPADTGPASQDLRLTSDSLEHLIPFPGFYPLANPSEPDDLVQGMAPAETLEASIVTISGEPLTARFRGERSEIGVGNEVSLRPAVATVTRKDLPVSRTGRDWHRVRPITDLAGKRQRLLERRRLAEDPRMRDDTEETARLPEITWTYSPGRGLRLASARSPDLPRCNLACYDQGLIASLLTAR